MQALTSEQQELVVQNQGLAYTFAPRFGVPRGLDREEAVSEGMYSLVLAAGHYRPQEGVKFSTYATNVIRNNVIRAAIKHARGRGIGEQETIELAYVEDPMLALEAQDVAAAAARVLNPQEWQVFSRRLRGERVKVIAGTMGRSKQRIMQVLGSARAKLREALKAA